MAGRGLGGVCPSSAKMRTGSQTAFPLFFGAGDHLVGIPSRMLQGYKPKLFPPCLQERVSMAAKWAATVPVCRAKTGKQACWCLKAQWCQAHVKHCIVMGWSLNLCGLTEILPYTSLPPPPGTSGYLINPVFYYLCCYRC